MVKLWDINNKKYNYSKSIQGIFGIGQAAFDNSLMVGDALDLFSDIAKDIFDVAGDVSTIVGLVTALMPDPKGEIKQKWDNFLASYVESRDGKIDPDVKDIRMSVYTTHKKEKFCEQRGLRIVSGFRTLTTRTTELDYYNPKTRKNPTVKIKEESWIDY